MGPPWDPARDSQSCGAGEGGCSRCRRWRRSSRSVVPPSTGSWSGRAACYPGEQRHPSSSRGLGLPPESRRRSARSSSKRFKAGGGARCRSCSETSDTPTTPTTWTGSIRGPSPASRTRCSRPGSLVSMAGSTTARRASMASPRDAASRAGSTLCPGEGASASQMTMTTIRGTRIRSYDSRNRPRRRRCG